MDVVVGVGDNRIQARIPTGERGSWARNLTGQDVTVGFRANGAALYDENGARIQQPAGVNHAAAVGV
jgi:hypothetical protein